jgi:hypothetical protein
MDIAADLKSFAITSVEEQICTTQRAIVAERIAEDIDGEEVKKLTADVVGVQ